MRDPDSGEERFARVKVPEGCRASSRSASAASLIPLESVISHYLGWLFPEMEIAERAAFRVTRDGDTEISDDADDLLEAVESELRKRRFGAVVRLEVVELDLERDGRAARGAARGRGPTRLPDPRAARPRRRARSSTTSTAPT